MSEKERMIELAGLLTEGSKSDAYDEISKKHKMLDFQDGTASALFSDPKSLAKAWKDVQSILRKHDYYHLKSSRGKIEKYEYGKADLKSRAARKMKLGGTLSVTIEREDGFDSHKPHEVRMATLGIHKG